MFWPLVFPLEITFWVFVVALIATLVFAWCSKWPTFTVAGVGLLACLIAFIPSCIGISHVVDQYRFGKFSHATYDDVNDFRIERYLPPDAVDISLFKHFSGNGYHAKYIIDESELASYLDDMWESFETYSAIKRAEFSDYGEVVENFAGTQFDALGWDIPVSARVFHSPVEPDGGGATYYHDRETGVTFQRAGYW